MPDGNSDAPHTVAAAPRPRIQTLSDLIFGLALSIGAIALLSEKPSTFADLLGSLAAFGFSFLILGLVWIRYTRIMSVLPIEGSVLGANMLLLFLVSIEPYLYNLIDFASVPGQVDPASVTLVYAVDLAMIYLILAYFTNELTREERRLIPASLLRNYRLERNLSLIVALVFLSSALPFFWALTVFGLQARLVLWLSTFGVANLTRVFATRWARGSVEGLHAGSRRLGCLLELKRCGRRELNPGYQLGKLARLLQAWCPTRLDDDRAVPVEKLTG